MNRLSYKEVKNFFEENECILLSTEYENNKQLLDYICICGKQDKKRFRDFKNGQRCKECAINNNADRQRHSYKFINNQFEKEGCILLSIVYENSNQVLDYICSCGNKSKVRYYSFKQGVRCKECGIKKYSNSQKYPFDEVKSIFESNGCILLSTNYINNHKKLIYVCTCGKQDEKSLMSFLEGQRCKECGFKKLSENLKGRPGLRGEDSPHWKPEKTMEERINHRDLPEKLDWRKEVFERYHYTCQCCGDNKGGNLVAHHLDGYDWCKESRWDVNNGITLCNTCHNDFHRVFGYGLNTREQFEEYMEGISWNCVGIYKNINVVV